MDVSAKNRPQFWSNRAVVTLELTAGSASAYSEAYDAGGFAGGAMLVPSNLAASTYLTLQATYDSGTTWDHCRDADGLYIQIDNTNAGDWQTLKADAYPYGDCRWAVTDGSGTDAAGTLVYTIELVYKS